MKPSCFGFASVYNSQGEKCMPCKWQSACRDACKSTLLRLYARTGQMPPVVGVQNKITKCVLTTEQLTKVSQLPVKLGPRYAALIRKGVHLRAPKELADGRNPFMGDGNNRYLAVACEQILQRPISKKALSLIYQEAFGWTEGTARAYVAAASMLLPALGVAVADFRSLKLEPSLQLNNR